MSIQNVAEQLEMNHVGMGIRKVAQIVVPGDFTDGGGADGTLNLDKKIPAGSFVLGSKVTVKTAFDGTTPVLSIGTAGDADEYSGNTTHTVSAVARNLVKAAFISADAGLVAEPSDISVKLTLSESGDFGLITAGEMLVEIFYLSTNLELTDYQPTEVNLTG
ncbi:hypothetical protein LCGC14_0623980 [marine sediment metagenome]|uniref:Uncharacterized protein n=1 Tax=marine sediment metagenome TaxID=412755 RepID=A0A0F9R421_9ZZZZ